MPRKTLKDRHRIFIAEYMRDWNASAAAVRAGYSPGNANVVGPRLLATVRIRHEIERRIATREKRYEVTRERIVREMARIAFADLRDFAAFDEHGKLLPFNLSMLPDDVTSAIVEISQDGEGRVRFKLGDKVATLRDLGKHFGMFNKKLELPAGSIKLEDLILEGARAMQQQRREQEHEAEKANGHDKDPPPLRH